MIQDRTLRGLVDTWLVGQDEDSFVEMLPMLRRSFSSFDGMGRRRLLLALEAPRNEPAAPPGSARLSPAFDEALPLLLTILGLREGEHP